MKVFIENVTAIVDGVEQEKGKLYIESDTLGYQVKTISGTRIDDKTGKETEISTTHGYFTNIQGCVKHLLSMKLKESTSNTLGELLRDVEDIRLYIEQKVTV